jgi:two-component SAPR family response regulator
MRIAVIDNDSFSLARSCEVIRKVRSTDQVYSFDEGLKLLEFIIENPCEVIFMDPCLKDIDGGILAEEIKEILPQVNIVFHTEHDEFYRKAMEIRASGYVLKPLREVDVREEFKNLRYMPERGSENLLQIECFGNFVVQTAKGEKIHFERKKSKEMFAYLVHRKGTESTLREAAAILFEDESFDEKHQNYMQKIISSMMKTLREYGVEEVIDKQFNSMRIRTDKVDCDYYHFIETGAELGFEKEQSYMENYTWADFT